MSGAHRAEPADRVAVPEVAASSLAPTVAATRDLGAQIGALLRAGDLVVLSGELGAGKTTFAQGLASRLDVRGAVTSPTFVIARVHTSLRGGPDLVHVDAYRLDSMAEVDDLDLDASLAESVTVVEWGGGLVEGLATDWLEVGLSRPRGSEGGPDWPESVGDEPRRITFAGYGGRWAGVHLPTGPRTTP